MSPLLPLFLVILPVIIAGVLNMAFVKMRWLDSLKTPMDGGRVYRDGKRIFGDNKTWKGFLGMIVLTSLSMSALHAFAMLSPEFRAISLLPYGEWNYPVEGLLYGALWGLAYVLAELPNSFVKRRIDIQPGSNAAGIKGAVFLVVDQADSVLGCLLVMPVFFTPTLTDAVAMLVMATGLHLVFNALLYLVGLKKQPA